MKKLLVFLFVILLLCLSNLTCVQDLTLTTIFPPANVEVYTCSKSKTEGLSKIDNGLGEIIFCDIESLEYILKNFNNVTGFTLKFDVENVSKLQIFELLAAQRFDNYNFGFIGYSIVLEKILNNKFSVNIDKKKCNFQLFETDTYIFLGIPLILGSY